MGIFNKANVIELTSEDLQDAKSTAGIFQDEFVKHRAFANVIAARAALKLLFSLNIDATNLYSMYSINKVLEKIDIADVYAGSFRIDARLVCDSGEIFIPKSHFNLGIVPNLYVIFKIDKGMSSVEFLGCVNPEEMDKSKENKDYYFVDEDMLYNLKIFKNLVRNNIDIASTYVPSDDDVERAKNLIVPLEDGEIFNADYEFLIHQLAFNVELRKQTVEFENFEFVSKKVVTNETVYGDSVLGLVGTEKLYNRNEFTADVDLEELSDETVDSFVDDFNEMDYVAPQMDEMTGEISLDDALNQMDDVFPSSDVPQISEEEEDQRLDDDFSSDNNNINESSSIDLDSFIDEISEFNSSSGDLSIQSEHKLVDENNIENYDENLVTLDEVDDYINEDYVNHTQSNEDELVALDEADDYINEDYVNHTKPDEEELVALDEADDYINEDYVNHTQSNEEELVALDKADDYINEDYVNHTQSNEEELVALDEADDYINEDYVNHTQSNEEELVALDKADDYINEDYVNHTQSEDEELVALDEADDYVNEDFVNHVQSDEEGIVTSDETGDYKNDDFADDSKLDTDDIIGLDDINSHPSDYNKSNDAEEDDLIIPADEDLSLDFDEDFSGDMDLPDLDGFSVDDSATNSNISNESFENEHLISDGEDSLVQVQKQNFEQPVQASSVPSQKEIKPFEDDDEDIGDLPVLKIVKESEDTYKKKLYKTPKIDDIDMENVNLDDFDDYESEDKEENEKQTQEIDEMMSDLDSLLNSENISLEGVEDILTDEDLNESLRQLEEEENLKRQQEEEVLKAQQEAQAEFDKQFEEDNQETDYSEEQYQESSEAENVNSENEQGNADSSSMSLDDFLNSSSFNDMSTNDENSDNIDNKQGLNDIYKDESILSQQSIADDNPERLLTDEATMVDNSANLYDEQSIGTESIKPKPKSRAPQLAVVLVVLMCACVYVNKDIIMDNFNISFPKKAEEEPVPEFDLNSLKEPQPVSPDAEQVPVETQQTEENPIPSLPQPTDMPDTPPAPVAASAPDAPQTPSHVPQNTSNKITKLSWEVPENLANNDKIRRYLQIAGRTLKLSLQNDLLVATELPFSNKIMLDLKIVPSGNLVSSDFIISSGSKQIDNIVLQSVKDTLKYVRPPLGEIQSPNSNITLIINF